MNKFLEIVYVSQMEGEFEKVYDENFAPVLERLQQLLSNSLYEEVSEILFDCSMEFGKAHATKGMEIAIGVMDGSYIPKM